MNTEPLQEANQDAPKENTRDVTAKAAALCFAGLLVPGLGHALNGKWARAAVFFFSISIMIALGLQMNGQLFPPAFGDIFATLKFFAEAGSGLLYWIPWLAGLASGDPRSYTYDYANLFLYVAGLLNMLVVVDVFDISLGRKQ
jgi:hypothetical protein